MNFNAKHLPSINAGHYKNTAACETEVMPVPDVVKISMSQQIGAPCKPLVEKGDKVYVGQLIGDANAFVSAPIHSSVSGTVTEVEVSAATATADKVVKYTASLTFNGKTYTTETGNVTLPGTATGEPDTPPTEPTDPDTPTGSNICKWDNVDHGTSFWGRLVKFFHSILYFFAHLFGRR